MLAIDVVWQGTALGDPCVTLQLLSINVRARGATCAHEAPPFLTESCPAIPQTKIRSGGMSTWLHPQQQARLQFTSWLVVRTSALLLLTGRTESNHEHATGTKRVVN